MKKNLLSKGAFLLLLIAPIAAAYYFNWFDSWQNKLWDQFFIKGGNAGVLVVAIDDESLAELGQWPWPRELMAELLTRLEGAAVIAVDINFSEPSRLGEDDDAALATVLAKLKSSVILPVEINERGDVIQPLAFFADKVDLGLVNVALDYDGVARRLMVDDGQWPLFAELIAGKAADEFWGKRINYLGPAGTVASIPAVDVLRSRLSANFWRGKKVIVGATAADLHDYLLTPFGLMAGAEWQANLAAALEAGNFFDELPVGAGLAFVLIIGLMTAAAVLLIKKWQLLLAVLVIILAAINGAALVLFSFNWLIPNLYLSAAFALAAGGFGFFQYFAEFKEKRFLRRIFQYYLPPEVLEEIARDPDKLKLGGDRRKVTILFSDVRGFTTLAEKTKPEDLVALLNEYFAEMVDIILASGGLLEKYIGDALMVVWGAPLANDKQAEDACRSAILMIKKLEELNRRWQARGLGEFAIGVGINTAEVVAGNIGSEKRLNYGIVGDGVNLASRLEGLNKFYGTRCIISGETEKELAKAGDGAEGFVLRDLDLVLVKGKSQPVQLYELIAQPVDERLAEVLRLFAEGKDFYAAGRWEEAIAKFEAAAAVNGDGPSKLFAERCRELKANPPAEWRGVYQFTAK